ncbi:uncharacterized protein LOC111336511 [Stylophora pistillata]|uniref:uncharacterized protein LOC111336511 n=1 Tax=Stylophora pistillata TaxID=50429 RepID=UPI000C03E18E|nr:uncharacterized protein LOC111336511 [Stylophora pistillata]
MSFSKGIAFSGGGIRSAAFCSGVLRYVLQHEIVLDYLSCVSGGGFTGASYLDWKYHHNQQDNPEWHQEFFDHLRKRSGFFCSWRNPFLGIIDSLMLVILCVVVAVIFPAFTTLAFALPTAFSVDYIFGDILRAGFHCPNDSAPKNATESEGCLFVQGHDQTFTLFGVVWATCVGFYVLRFLFPPRHFSIRNKLKVFYVSAGCTLLMTFLPWFFEVFLRVHTSVYVNGFLLLGSIALWLGFPPLRNTASLALLIYAYAYVTKWRVYKSPVLHISYSDNLFYKALLGSAILLWMTPFLGLFNMGAVQTYNRWRLQKAFFSPQSTGCLGCSGISFHDIIPFCSCADTPEWERLDKGFVTMGDLADMKPEYICNTVVNNWQKEAGGVGSKSFELLILSPTGIERLDENPEDNSFAGKIQPRDLPLSDVMATSAAVLALYMGVFDVRAETVRNLQMVLGVHGGKSLISDPSRDVAGSTIACCRFLPVIIQLFIVVPVILPPFLTNDWHAILVVWYLTIVVLAMVTAALPTAPENSGCADKFVRWCTVNIYHVRFARLLLRTVDLGPVPPPLLNLSDGGHIEQLGLLALLKKRLKKIVVVDGTSVGVGQSASAQLLWSLDLARKRLRCSFSAMDGRDIVEDLRSKLEEMPDNCKPRFYKFRVDYYEKNVDGLSDEKVGEGEILLILPRHPDVGITNSTESLRSWTDCIRHTHQPINSKLWGPGPDLEAGEVDRLTGCCCECCHVTYYNSCCGILCGFFPYHKTLNQFFTPAMFSAYHREGYRACLDADIGQFLTEETGGKK